MTTDGSAVRRGFTMIEALATASIIVIVASMGMTIVPAMKKAQIQSRAVAKMKLLASHQEDFRGIGDLGVNPDGSYGTFFELQNAGYIARDLTNEDTTGHGGTPFLLFYKVEVGRDIATMSLEPDPFNYAVVATPVGAPSGLPVLFMEEDGEVFTLDPDGSQRVIR